jgi:GNAT superfamily N-acetyltransferase
LTPKRKELIKITGIDSKTLKDVPSPCNCCLYWQTSGPFQNKKSKKERMKRKLEWFSDVIRKFGNCGRIAYLNATPIGFAQYAPAKYFPRVKDYDAGPPSEDAVFLACLYITDKKSRRKGFGTAMLEDLIAELKERGIGAVETFAGRDSQNNPSGPIQLYSKHGFKIEGQKDNFPLVRLELRNLY